MTPHCEEFRQRISDFLDGDLDAAAMDAMGAHARTCARCGALLATTRETLRIAGDERYFTMPDAASARLRQALEAGLGEPLLPADLRPPAAAAIAPPARRRGWLGAILAGMPRAVWAAVIVILVLGIGIVRWRAGAVTTSGWLIDSHCYALFSGHPGDHSRACLLKCAAETYGLVDAKGKFHPFDDNGKRTALAAVMASHRTDHLWVTVKVARSSSPTLHVEQLELTAPGSTEFSGTR